MNRLNKTESAFFRFFCMSLACRGSSSRAYCITHIFLAYCLLSLFAMKPKHENNKQKYLNNYLIGNNMLYEVVFVVVLFFNVHGKHLRSCRDDQLT